MKNKRGESHGCLMIILIIFGIIALFSSAGLGTFAEALGAGSNGGASAGVTASPGTKSTTATTTASTTVETTTQTSSTTAEPNYSDGAQCEYAFVVHFRNNNHPNDSAMNYDMYYLFDTDTNRTYTFISSNLSSVDVGTYTGDLSGAAWGVEVNWSYDDGSTYWQYVSGSDDSIDVSDEIGYCFYGERVSSSEAESMVMLP